MKVVGVFLVSLVLLLLAVVAASSQFHPIGAPAVDIDRGQQVFQGNCAGCHSIVEGQGGGLGPGLAGIAGVAGSRVEGMEAEVFILQSILYPDAYRMQGSQGAMPAAIGASLTDAELRDLVGYLMNLDGQLDSAMISALTIKRPARVESAEVALNWPALQQGFELFYNELGCSSCHEILDFPSSSLIAPSLEHASVLDEDYIRQSIREPSVVISPTYRQVTLTTLEGESFTGREWMQDEDTIEIITGIPVDPVRQEFLKKNLKSISASDISTMPPYQLSERDEDLLVGFLRFLGGD